MFKKPIVSLTHTCLSTMGLDAALKQVKRTAHDAVTNRAEDAPPEDRPSRQVIRRQMIKQRKAQERAIQGGRHV